MTIQYLNITSGCYLKKSEAAYSVPYLFKTLKMSGVAACAVLAGMASETKAQEPTQEPIEEIQVTGSRIQRTGMETPTPVTAVQASEMENMAPGLMIEALDQMPQFRNNETPGTGSAFGSTGGQVNMRGLGSNRTLVLLDGRRIIGTTYRGAVDIGLFPEMLVRQVEVVTGGASAAYGSDAVAGVTNFILDTEFTGVEAKVQGGVTSRWDGENGEVGLAAGMPVGDRGHVVFSADYYKHARVAGYEGRDWHRSCAVIDNPDSEGPASITGCPVHNVMATYGGLITGGPLQGTQFLEGGEPAQFHPGKVVSPGQGQIGGSGSDQSARNYALYPNDQRANAFLHFSYEVSDDVEAYVQGMYGDHDIVTGASDFPLVLPWDFEIQRDNAYLPESIRQRMIEEDIESFPMGRLRGFDNVENPADNPVDLGQAKRRTDNDMISFTTGFDAEVEDLRVNAYYQYGQNKQRQDYGANNQQIRTDRLWRAVDAVEHPETGEIVCRTELTGISGEEEAALGGDPQNADCVPINLFGFGSPSQEALNYIHSANEYRQKVKQHFAEFTVQGEPFETWAGPVSLFGGASYRKDSVWQNAFAPRFGPDERALIEYKPLDNETVGYAEMPTVLLTPGVFHIGNPNSDGTPIEGSFNVKEVFSETFVPLAANTGFAQRLDLTAAVRYADYSGSGGVWAWKGGLDWALTDSVRFRGTYSRDTRAGTLSERFDTQRGGGDIDDPFRPELPRYRTTVESGGNPEVGPEKSDTITFGAVYQPNWAPGLGISLDYYSVKIKGAISQLGSQEIVDRCFAGADDLCNLISRNEAGEIQLIRDVFINIAQEKTEGIDLEVNYGAPVSLFGGVENISFRGFLNYTWEVSNQTEGEPKLDRAGDISNSLPELMGNASVTYTNGPFSFYVQERYIDGGKRDVTEVEGVDIDDNSVESVWYTNARVSYNFDAMGGNYEIFAHVSNVFDQSPPMVPGDFSVIGGSAQTNTGLYDVLGRRYTFGVEMQY